MAEKDEKQTRTSVGVGNTEINRETRSSESSGDSYRDRDRYDRDRDRYDRDRDRYDRDRYDEDDWDRIRRGARDFRDSLRDTGCAGQRESTNILTAGCDLIGNFFVGIGEAISPRARGGSSSSLANCGPASSCAGGTQDEDRGPRPPGRTTASHTEIRRTTAR